MAKVSQGYHNFHVDSLSSLVELSFEELPYCASRGYVFSAFGRKRKQDIDTREKCSGICGHGQFRARIGLLLTQIPESPWDRTGVCKYMLKSETLYESFPARLPRCQECHAHVKCESQPFDSKLAMLKRRPLRLRADYSASMCYLVRIIS